MVPAALPPSRWRRCTAIVLVFGGREGGRRLACGKGEEEKTEGFGGCSRPADA